MIRAVFSAGSARQEEVALGRGNQDEPAAAAAGSAAEMASAALRAAGPYGGTAGTVPTWRRLNDPRPLPVSWVAADPSLTDAWDSLARLATSGAGWPEPQAAAAWAPGPEDLAGTGSELVDVLARVPTGRRAVLGEPGTGKTMLMVRLVLDLLARRDPGDPVPFLASVASWDPSSQNLRSWLADRLTIDHPALAAASTIAALSRSRYGPRTDRARVASTACSWPDKTIWYGLGIGMRSLCRTRASTRHDTAMARAAGRR